MSADQVLDYVQKWSIGKTVNLNDYSDKFHYLLMTIVLVLFATITTVKQYVFQPIICELASKPSSMNFAEYVSNLCWLEGTIAISNPEQANLSIRDDYWEKQPKSFYYQWVPFTLALQAVMFYLPRLLWVAYAHNREGPDLEALLESAAEANKTVDWKLRQGMIDGIARNIDHMLTLRQDAEQPRSFSRRGRWRRCFADRPRGCLPAAYAVMKLLFLGNDFTQLYLMGRQLEPDHPQPLLFGFRLIGKLQSGEDWRSSKLFPRLAICRLLVQHLGAVNKYTAMCVLPINMLSEKIYCFLWIATALGACLTCLSLVQWAMRIVCGQGHWRHHLRRYLLRSRAAQCLQQVPQFAAHLHSEGVFLVHMLRLNVGEVVACDVTCALYKLWSERQADADSETELQAIIAGPPSPKKQ